jgi:6,7-dimethyl-8-ribityllumazine synthase
MSKAVLIVTAPYYKNISDMLVAGATMAINNAGFKAEMITVPGALEIAAAISIAHGSHRYAGFVALGCVIRGETMHYEIVSNESARGLQDLAVHTQAAIGNGILTCETMEQALARADTAQGNKGGEAALACLRLIELRHLFGLDHA